MGLMGSVNVIYIILFIVFLLLAGFFASAEVAFIGMQHLRIEHLVRTGDARAKLVARIMKNPSQFLATVLFGINLFETAAASLGTILAVYLWGEQLGAAIAIIIVTILTLVLAEFIPKTMATRYGEKIALNYARPIEIISIMFYPFVFALKFIGRPINTKGENNEGKPTISQEEFRTMISVGHEQGTVEKGAADICQRVFDFGDKLAREVMIPRPEVISIERSARLGEFLQLFTEHGFSRVPVYEGNTDNLVGILAIKDVLMALSKGDGDRDSLIEPLIRPAYFVPETKRISDLFAEMRGKNFHIAVLVDEYGGLAGIVSMNQLIEEIVGPVGDELGESEKEFETVNESTYAIDGGMQLVEANEEMGLDLPEGEYETMAGFVLHLLGRIPKQGDQMRYKGLRIVISEMRGMKIEKIMVIKEKHATPKD
jgi:putative hemolysin